MKKKSLLLILLMALIAPWALNAQQALPYSYGFENNDLEAEGWAVQKTSSSTGIYSVGASAAYEGTYVFRFQYSEQNAYLVSPLLTGTNSGVDLSFYYKEYSASYGDEQFYVGYTTDESVTDPTAFTYGSIVTASMTWEEYAAVLPAGTKRVAIKYVYNDAFYLYLDAFTFSVPTSCTKPTGLEVALTPGNGSVATFSWTENGDATAWQLCLNGDESDLIPMTTNPFTYNRFTPEETYTAKVRSNCGSEQSAWSNEVTFTPTNSYAVTVNNGTSTNGYVPIYGYYVDNISKSQFIIPAESLEELEYGTIDKMVFYASADKDWGVAEFEVYVAETDETTLSALVDYATMEKVMNSATLGISGNQMEVVFDNPYQYEGGNLMIGFLQTVSGTYQSCSWYGVAATGASMGGYGSSISQQNFLPKTTFYYTPGSAPACAKPKNPVVSDIDTHTAVFDWTSDASAWVVAYSTDGQDFREQATTTKPYTFNNLDAHTTYIVKVRANCGSDGYSDWSKEVTFETLESCPTPTDMTITDVAAFSANIGWTSSNENFDLRYSVNPAFVTDFEDHLMGSWTTIDADGDGYTWVLGSEAGGIYLAAGGSLAGSGHEGSEQDLVVSGSYSNYTGNPLTPDNYLVSPQITLGGSISFWACAQDASYPAEHFGVAVSTTGNTSGDDFTTIQEWSMTAKGAPTLRSSNAPRGMNRAQGNWYQYTVDLSAYSGQGYVAIRHFYCTDQFMLDVDDIAIAEPNDYQWVNVTNPTNPQPLTNLAEQTNYIVQVRANCGSETSDWLTGTFTTLPSCLAPTGLTVSNIGKRSADLAWTANGDEEAWQICVNGDEENLINVTTTTYTLEGLTPDETEYVVKVRANCGEHQSAWSNPVTFYTEIACPAPTYVSVYDITGFQATVEWGSETDIELQYALDTWKHYDDGIYASNIGAGGTVYWGVMFPAASLEAGTPLTKVALHTSYPGDATMNIYLGGDQPTGTPAVTQDFTMAGDGDFMEITLDTPLAIDGTKNLWVTFYQSGVTYPIDGCADTGDPNGRWVSLDGESWADVTTYSLNYTWMVRAAFGNAQTEWITVENASSPQVLTGLTPETNYFARVKDICGGIDGESVWTTAMFTTDVACPAPTGLAATPYANSAVLSWDGSSDSYLVSYRTAAYTAGFEERFDATSIPTDWTRYNTQLTDDVLNGTTDLTSTTYGWSFGTSNGVFDSHARMNVYSTNKYWLVTPAIDVAENATFSFDLALTAYSGTNVAPQTTGTDDRFVVLVSTDNMDTWTILRQWDNAGSEYVFNNIPYSATGENVSIDFSEYGRQTVYIAFYGESTEANADNNLHIDNVAVGSPVEAGAWQTVTVNESPAAITGLTPLTVYEAKVQGNCGTWGMSEESNIISFTTGEDTCPTPTGLAYDNVTATTADLTWNGSPDVESFTVRYKTMDHATGLYETFGTSLPTGWEMYTGLLNNVMSGTALTSVTYGWNAGTANGVFDNHIRVNIYGSSCNRWLVLPTVNVPSANFSFDLALTNYNGTLQQVVDTLQQDDRFVVLISTDDMASWTILREWNNTGSEYVYNNIACSATGESVSINLSAYVGQNVRIAFYGESTNPSGVANTGGDNNMHIDNLLIGDIIPGATEWETASTTTSSITLTGLSPKTPYEAQVKSDCSEPEAWTASITFTTPEYKQVLELAAGTNLCSFNVELTLDELKAALLAALPGATNITIKSQNQSTKWNGRRWNGSLTWSLGNMYKIIVPSECELTLDGTPVDPATLTITIAPGTNFIAFPFTTEMTLAEAFAGFALNGDMVKSQQGNAKYNGRRWNGAFPLVPGQGYKYVSASTTTRTFTFPAPTSK